MLVRGDVAEGESLSLLDCAAWGPQDGIIWSRTAGHRAGQCHMEEDGSTWSRRLTRLTAQPETLALGPAWAESSSTTAGAGGGRKTLVAAQ